MKKIVFIGLVGMTILSCTKQYQNELRTTTLHLSTKDYLTGQPAQNVDFTVYGAVRNQNHEIGTKGVTNEYGNYNGSFNTYSTDQYSLEFNSHFYIPNTYDSGIAQAEFNQMEVEVFSLGEIQVNAFDSLGGELKNFSITCMEDYSLAPYNVGSTKDEYFRYNLDPNYEHPLLLKLTGTWNVSYDIREAGSSWTTYDTLINVLPMDTLILNVAY